MVGVGPSFLGNYAEAPNAPRHGWVDVCVHGLCDVPAHVLNNLQIGSLRQCEPLGATLGVWRTNAKAKTPFTFLLYPALELQALCFERRMPSESP